MILTILIVCFTLMSLFILIGAMIYGVPMATRYIMDEIDSGRRPKTLYVLGLIFLWFFNPACFGGNKDKDDDLM